MITEENISQLGRIFKRLFALPVSRMTLKELQSAINETFDNKPISQAIYNSLLTGEIAENLEGQENASEISNLIDDYSFHVRIAKEVAEHGDFINSFSCEFLQQGNQIYFVNRMRRIDGQEYHFHSAPETNIRLAHMFISRLKDLKIQGAGKIKINELLENELREIMEDIQQVIE